MKSELENLRDILTELITTAKEIEASSNAPAVQEVVLARRHLEDARMRLGVAEAYNRGLDPWANQVKE